MPEDTSKKQLWVARDEDGQIFLYFDKPYHDKKDGEYGSFYPKDNNPLSFKWLHKEAFPEVTYENSPQPLIPLLTLNDYDI